MNPENYSPTVRVGDRVTVRDTRFGSAQIHVGRTGTVKAIRRGYFNDGPFGDYDRIDVQMDVPRPEQVVATKVEKVVEPLPEPGDRVVIRECYYLGSREFIGAEATVVENGFNNTPDGSILVTPDGQTRNIFATRWEKLDKAEAPEPTTNPDILLDPRRMQAAALAHQIIGDDALIEDLITLAEFFLAEPLPAMIGSVEMAEPPAPAREKELLSAGSLDAAKCLTGQGFTDDNPSGNPISAAIDTWADDDVVRIEIDGCPSYLTAPRARALAAYLEACALVHESK